MRAAVLLAACTALSTGCDSVFGLERGATEPVRVNVARRYLMNDAAFTSTFEDQPFTVEELPAVEAFTEAGEPLDVELTYPVSSIVIHRPVGERYRVVLRLAAADVPLELQSDLPELTFREEVPRRRTAARSASFTDLHGTVTPSGSVHLSTTGVLERIDLGVAGPYVARPAYMLDSTLGDRAYFTRFGMLGSANTITQLAEVDIRMSVGANLRDVVLIDTVQNYCAHVTAQTTEELARVTARYPTYTTQAGTAWQLLATPSLEIRPNVLYTLAYQALAGSDVDVRYLNPFRGFATLFNLGVQRARKVDEVLTLFVGTTTMYRFPEDLECAPRILTSGVGAVPAGARLAGTALDTDRVEIQLASPLLLEYDAEGPADLFVAHLDDVTAGARRLRSYVGAHPRFAIAPELLVPGNTYVFQIFARTGYPGAAGGDFAEISFPHSTGYGHSSLFTVAN
jgi:hypothetical protein